MRSSKLLVPNFFCSIFDINLKLTSSYYNPEKIVIWAFGRKGENSQNCASCNSFAIPNSALYFKSVHHWNPIFKVFILIHFGWVPCVGHHHFLMLQFHKHQVGIGTWFCNEPEEEVVGGGITCYILPFSIVHLPFSVCEDLHKLQCTKE